jgi:hypothetical protein
MCKQRYLYLILSTLVLFSLSTVAQDTPAVTLLTFPEPNQPFDARLITVTVDGTHQTINLPESVRHAPDATLRSAIISDDMSYLVTHQSSSDFASNQLSVYNLATGQCCTVLSQLGAVDSYSLGAFEPNGTRFAVSYVRLTGGDAYAVGGIAIFDAVDGALLSNVTMDEIAQRLPITAGAVWARMGDWTARGIEFVGNCYGCDGGAFEGYYNLYMPDSNSFTISDSYFAIFGDVLTATGEVLYPVEDRRYVYSPEPSMFGRANVVLYFEDGVPDNDERLVLFSGSEIGGTIAYADSTMNDINDVEWVSNGQQFLVGERDKPFWHVVDRATGGVQQVTKSHPSAYALAGTRDGWLAVAPTESGLNQLSAYTQNSAVSVITGFPQTHTISVIADYPLMPAMTPAFPAIAPLTEAFALCDGFMPSRLQAGERARVTPGAPNRIRSGPTTNSDIVGQIPGGAEFMVQGGPLCDPDNGIAWWQINYNGQTGWTAEGQGDTYWTEPLDG